MEDDRALEAHMGPEAAVVQEAELWPGYLEMRLRARRVVDVASHVYLSWAVPLVKGIRPVYSRFFSVR
jgi:hypothetical protein